MRLIDFIAYNYYYEHLSKQYQPPKAPFTLMKQDMHDIINNNARLGVTPDGVLAIHEFLQWYRYQNERLRTSPIELSMEEIISYYENLEVSDSIIRRLPREFQPN